MGGRFPAAVVIALAGAFLSGPISGSSPVWAAAESGPARPAHVVLLKSSAATPRNVWPSIDGAMSAGFSAPAAYDATGLVAPSYAGWLTDPPRRAPSGGTFVARAQATSGIEAIQQSIAAPPRVPSQALPSGVVSSFAPIESSVPLPPKRLVEKREVVMAALAPLPPRRLSEPAPVPAALVEAAPEEAPPSRDAATGQNAIGEDGIGEDVAAPVGNAAAPIDDAPEPVRGRLTAERAPPHIEALIERHARRFDVPARLVRRVAWRESKFDPSQRHGPYWGLMQIRVDTARGLGFRGAPRDLLDANTNMTYAVAYLANAYRVAGRDEKRAVMLYASGYYYEAKRKGMLGSLIRTASAEE